MAAKKATGESRKVVFGTRRKGKHSKSVGPKAQKRKRYKGQGR
jgi:hypothetical protein